MAFLPDQFEYGPGDACVVVDAVRAGATLVTMAEAGDPEVYLASSAEAARAYRDAKAPHALLGARPGACRRI